METKRKLALGLVLLQAWIISCHSDMSLNCPSHPDKNLTCYSDFNYTITCAWDSASHQTDSGCTLKALYSEPGYTPYSKSCDLQPVDVARPAVKMCPLIFEHKYFFFPGDKLSISVSCNSPEPTVAIKFVPSCQVKVTLEKPAVLDATISWNCDHEYIEHFSHELQWKRQNQLWSDVRPLVQKDSTFAEVLNEDLLIQGEAYETRVRMKVNSEDFRGPWSDWSPTASWVSSVGQPKQPTPFPVGVWQMVVASAAVVALVALPLIIARLRTDKTWVYMVKKIQGPPLPNPAKSSLQDAARLVWSNPYFNKTYFYPIPKDIEIASVEVTSTVDAVTRLKPDPKMVVAKGNQESTGSSFSNPNYSAFRASPPLALAPAAGNLEACDADAPYGPVGSEAAEPRRAEGNCGGAGEKKVDIRELFSKGNGVGEPPVVTSDYERTEQRQIERDRLQSLDSGVCSGEEVSQESVDADGVAGREEVSQESVDADSVTGREEEEEEEEEDPAGGRERDEGGGTKVDFRELFGNGGGVLGKGSIQVCSDYEAVRTPSSDDSGVGGEGREPGRMEDIGEEEAAESTRLLLPPRHPPGALTCSFLPNTFTLLGPPLSPALQSQQSPLLGQITVTSGGSVEPSGDGYMPV